MIARAVEQPAWLCTETLLEKLRGLTTAEKGLLVTLLTQQIKCGPLPQDEQKLASLAMCSRRDFAQIWPRIKGRFTVTDDGALVIADVVMDRGHP